MEDEKKREVAAMPAVYAHDRFGAEVAEKLTGDLKEIISSYYTQYQIGLQGPDIFFFYKLHTSNKVVRFGEHLHHVSAYPFFCHAVKTVRKKGRNSREYAYLLGFLCHFVLDSECHPYVEAMIEETGVQHLEIEEEFEKLLIRLEGEDPFSCPLADLIPTDEVTARAIQPFYPVEVSENGMRQGIDRVLKEKLAAADLVQEEGHSYMSIDIIQQSLRDMKRIKKFFTAPQKSRQFAINSVMKLIGVHASMNGLMHQMKDNPKCVKTNAELKKKYDSAVDLAVELMGYLDDSIRNGTKLPKRFDRTFE